MSDTTARLSLPYLVSGQAQKDVTHNEALTLIDTCLAPNAEAVGLNQPPTSPLVGQCWIIGASPVGAWAGKAHALAAWTDGGWRFAKAVEGMRVWIKPQQLWCTYAGDDWIVGEERAARVVIQGEPVVGPRQPAVASPAGGTTIDVEARAAIDVIIARLEEHGLVASA